MQNAGNGKEPLFPENLDTARSNQYSGIQRSVVLKWHELSNVVEGYSRNEDNMND